MGQEDALRRKPEEDDNCCHDYNRFRAKALQGEHGGRGQITGKLQNKTTI